MAHIGRMETVLGAVRNAHEGRGREFSVHVLTAVLRLRPEPSQVEPLRRTLAAFSQACNFAIDAQRSLHAPFIAQGKYEEMWIPGENALQKACRDEIRLRFWLPGQDGQRCRQHRPGKVRRGVERRDREPRSKAQTET